MTTKVLQAFHVKKVMTMLTIVLSFEGAELVFFSSTEFLWNVTFEGFVLVYFFVSQNGCGM